LLHRLHARDQLREGGSGASSSLDPGAGDVRAVPGERRAGVEEERLRRPRTLLVADVVQRRRMLAEGDDVLVRRLLIVLAGGAEEGEVQIELAAIGVAEQPPELVVAARRA